MITITTKEARRALPTLIERVTATRELVTITCRRGSAVLMSRADYQSLEATALLVRSPANAQRLLESLAQARKASRAET